MEPTFERKKKSRETPFHLRKVAEVAMLAVCSEFTVDRFGSDGEDVIKKLREQFPDRQVIVVASHVAFMDVQAVVAALGKQFDFQITSESLNFTQKPEADMIALLGKERFSAIDYVSKDEKKRGQFHPQNFVPIQEKMKAGRTPWMAIHPFSPDGSMTRAKVGPIYLAQLSHAVILPVALDMQGKGGTAFRGSTAVLRVGEAIDLPPVDVGLFTQVLERGKGGEEFDQFRTIKASLKQQAEQVARVIAQLLPPEKRGMYAS